MNMRDIFKCLLASVLLVVGLMTAPARANVQTYSVIFGTWAIEDPSGNSIGFMDVYEINTDAPAADGQLFKNAGLFTSVASIEIRVRNIVREAYDFDVNFNSHVSGEEAQGRMLISLKGSNRNILGGSIELDGRFILITLKRQDGAANTFNRNDEQAKYDLPGFGITGPSYRLRNVPEGNNLLVRSQPDRRSSVIDRLGVFTRDILVLNCAPKIDAAQFDSTSVDGKRELLGGAWCLIQTPGPDSREGYVLGRYLDPDSGR